jgi:hypothetical protein
MNFNRIVLTVAALVAALGMVAADPAFARAKHKAKAAVSRCNPAPERPWFSLWSRPEPRPNGCAPAVYQYGKFIGQDPDRNIRQQLLRDPATGYSAHNNN